MERWCAALPEAAWQTLEVRDGEKGPLLVQGSRTLVQARTEGKAADEAMRPSVPYSLPRNG